MNEDQMHDAAEREMDLYRAEITRITAQRDEARAERDQLRDAMTALTKVAEGHERVMYAAAIDIRLGDPGGAKRLLGEQLDGYDGPEWDGTETGTQYLERARDGRAS